MARYKKAENPFREEYIDGDECVVFETEGKEKQEVIVDKRTLS